MAQDNESTKWLYKQLSQRGYNVGNDEAEFDELMRTNASSRKWAYNTAKASGLDVGEDQAEFDRLVSPGQQGSTPGRQESRQQSTAVGQAGSAAQQVVDEYDESVRKNQNAKEATPITDKDRSNMMGYARLIENKAGGVVNRGLEQIGISESRASSPLRVRRNNIGIGSEPIHVGESPNVVKTKDGKYATETGNVYDSRNLADYEQNQIDDIRRRELDPINTGLKDAYNEKAFLEARLTQRRRELDAKEKEQNKGIGGLLRSFAEASRIRGGAIDTDPDSKYQATDRDYMNISAALRENEKRIRSLEALRDKTSLGVAGTIGRALGNTLGTFGAWDFGRSDMQDATAMTFSRIGRGGYYEQEYLKNKVLADEAAAQEDKEMGDLYRWAKIGGTSVSWAKDFLLFNNPMRGITRLSTRAGLKTAERLALNGWKKAAMKNLGILAGDVAGSAALATTLQGRTTVKDITDRYSGEIGIADNGNLYFKGGDSFSDAVRRGVTSATIENYTEKLGEHLPSLAPLVKKGLARIGLSGMNRWIERAGASSAYKTMHDWLARSGFNGFGGEVAEEEINIALNALLVGDQSFSDYLDPKTHLDIVGGMALSMGMMGGGALASYGVQQGVNAWEYNRIRKRLSDADRVASYRFGQERWAPLKDAIDNTPNDGMADMMNGISSDSNMPVQEKQAAFQYIIRLLNMRGHNLKETAQSEENGNAEARPAETKIIHDDNGYTVVSVDDSGNQISSETFNNREDAETRIAEMGMRRKSDDVKSIYAIAMRLSPESGAAAIISQIEEDHGLESGALGKLVDKDPLKVTDEEQAILDDAYSRLKSLAYPNGELHTEQSMQEGVTMADEHEIAEDNDISEINGELDNARQAMENVFAANEPLHEDFMRLRQYGEAEVVDYLARNYRPEEVAAVCDYLNAKARRDGYVARTGGKIEEAVANETRKRTFSGNLNGEMHEHDQIIVVTDGQQEYRLASGDVMTDTQGRINPDASGSDIVVVCDSDGNLIPMKASAQLSVVRTENPDDFAKALTEQLQVDATAKIGIEQPLQGEAQADKETAAEEQAVQEDIATDAIPQVKPEEQQAQASGQQASRIPVDEQGAPQYHLAPIEDTIADLYDGQLSDDEIRQFVDANISDAEKAYQEIQKDAPKMSTDKGKYVADKAAWQAQVDEARQKAGYWQDVRKNIENMTHTTPDELEAARRELTGETPREEYLSQLSGEAQPSTATGLASMFIYDAKITPESFRKETGYTTTEQKRFVGMIASKQNGGKTIKELAEGLVSYDNTYTNGVFFHGDSNEARNAIIDALQSARSRAGLKDNMTDSYRDYVEQREQAREDYYQEAYHMSYEDYLEYSEREMPDLLRKYSNFDEQEFLNLYGEEIEQSINARRNEQGNDTAGEEPRTDSGTEVLHREGAGDERGTGRGQESASEVPPQRDGGNEEGAVRESTRQGNVEGDTVGGSPVALSYLLENGKGTIESSGYFLHGVAAAFPEITGQIEEIRGRYLDEINPSPIEYANSGHRSITEIRNLVDSVYGERGVSIFDKLLQNADGFVPHDGAVVAREIEELRPIGDGNKNGNISEEIDRTTIDPRSMSDSERQRRGDMLRNAPAIEVEAEQIVSTPELSARKVAERWWDENVPEPVFYDTEVGEVEINKNSVESSLAHRYSQAKLDAITSLVEGFENAVYLGTLPDFTRQEGVSSHYFAYPIIYKGKRCYVFCRAMQDANKNRLYVHEVFVAENIKKGDTLQTAASQPHGGIALYKDILVNVLEDKFSSSERRLTEPQGEGSDLVPSPNLVSSESKDSESPANGQTIGEKIAEEEAKVETSPSDAQKEAGNYKKGHVNIDGYDITIENPKGSVRSGIDAEGQPWSVTMNNTYGYIRGTEGVDGDHIDVFLSDDPTQGDVYVIDQVKEDGSFDEHKVMYGFKSALAAKRAYLANYSPGWQGLGTITKVSKDEFRKWVDSSHRKTKPFSEYKSVNKDSEQSKHKYETADEFIKEARNDYANVPRPEDVAIPQLKKLVDRVLSKGKDKHTDVHEQGYKSDHATLSGLYKREKDLLSPWRNTSVAWIDENEKAVYTVTYLPAQYKGKPDVVRVSKEYFDEQSLKNRPLSLADMREVEPEKHDWKYRVSVDSNTGRTMITRSETTNGVPVDDANFELTADSPQDMLDILGNPQNGMDEVLNAVRTDLENAVMTQAMDRSETNEASQPRQVDIEGVFNDLNRNGEARLSDHFVIGRPGLTERMGNEQTANGEKQQTDDGYGANNKVVSRDRYEELKKRMRNKIYGQLNVGIDPEILAIGTEMAVYHIEAGARKFADYARHMIDDLGDAIRPYLKTFYNGVRDMPEAEEAGLVADMAPYEEVRAFDMANFGKDVVNPMDTAATIRDEIRNEREAEGAKSEIIQQRNKKDAQRKRTAEKKSVSSQAEQGDLFANVNEQQNQEDNERVQGLQQRTAGERTKRHTGDTPRQVGESQRSEAEQPAGERVGTDSGTNVRDDRERSSRVAGLHESEGGRVARNRNNNHAERGLDYAPTTPKARYDANVAAIRLAKELTDSGQQATSEQKAVLRQFSGWGGLGTFFNNERTRRELVELLGDDGYQQAAISINSAYYTPASVVDTMWDIVKNLGFKGGKILEGSAGIGNILGLMPMEISDRSNIEAVEIDGLSGMILKLLYPDADVKIQGFENTQVRNGSVDLAITNVPFVTGLRVHDTTGDRDLSRRFGNIHDFCIAKNIRKLREGGIGVFISSNGTLDKSKGLRDWVTSEGNADFIGAFRLNNKTFGGTTATSDIIVVRKRVNGNKSAGAIDVLDTESVRTVDVPTGEYKTARGSYEEVKKPAVLQYNKYFVEHPEYMGGEMALNYEHGETFRPESSGLFPTSMIDQNARLRQWTETFKDKAVDTPQAQAEEAVAAQPAGEEGNETKDGTIVVGNDGNINVMYLGRPEPLNVNSNKVKGHTKAECVEDYNRLKKALAALLDYESTTEGNDGLQPLLKELNDAYDNFKGKYGNLNKNTAISFLRNDIDFPSIQALEKYTETNDKDGKRIAQTEKTAIFKERVVQKEVEPHPTNIVDAVKASVFKTGRIDIPYISGQLGMSNNEVKDSIVKGGYGFVDPATQEMEVSYEYLSGNVREKLAIAEANNEDGRYDNNIKALRKVVPMDIPAHLIEFTFGSSWVNPKLFSDYVSEKTGVDVKLTNVGGRWNMEMPYYIATEKNKAEGVRSRKLNKLIYGTDLMNAAINNQTITVSSTQKTWDGKTETVTDKEATQACAAKIDDIRNDFKDWARARMQSDPDMAREMERVYNDRFNNYVPVQVTDEFVRTQFPGASKKINLFPHQAKAAIRATGQPIMLAHEVGTGKTFTLITIAMEMRRLGLARKPMIVVQNATVGQFVESAKELYPNAKVLTIADNERNEEGRKKFYAKIKYNDWDMIVVPQSVFERIPDSEERQMAFINSRIEERQHVLEQMQKIDAKSIIARNAKRELDGLRAELVEVSDKKRQRDEKRAAKTRQNAAAKAQEQLDRVTDDVENFDDMEIDAVLVDEAHEYKHLGFSTAMQRGVKGVDPSYSKKSAGVYLKTRAVMDKSGGKNVVFATGTPISNTAAEIWTFMRYLMPEHTMREYGIYYFDDFVRNFGNLTQMLEFTTGGKFKENNRFAGYVNIPELMRIWSGVADTVLTSETDLKDKLPETVEGGQKATDIYLPQSASLRSIMKAVRTELERFDKMSGKEKKENSAIPLVMYGIAKAAAIDPRLVMADAADEPMSKTNRAVEETLKSLEATKGYKGTVAIFCDTYQNNQTGFNIYDEIKRKLVERGVPEKEIVIMRSGMSVNKKAEIFDKVNAGDVRVIMGSTFTLGTGVNIQERLNTLIHLDAPNRPMDYTQRNGRILRQGNLHKQWGLPVKILRFGVEDSLDITAYQRLKTKGAIADSVMEGKKFLNNNQQDRTLEEQEDVFGDTVAQLSGSEYALLKNQAERDYRKYSNKKKQYEADQIYVHNAIPRYEGQIKRSEDTIKQQRKALADVEKAFPGGNVQEISIGNSKLSGPKAIGDHIKDVVNKKQTETEDKVRGGLEGTKASTSFTVKAGPFTFTIRTEYSKDSEFQNGTLFPVVHRNMTYSCEQLGLEDVPVQRASFKNAIDDIMDNVLSGNDMRERIETETNLLERNRSDLEQLKSREGKPFENENELEEARKKVEDYTKKMKEEMEAKEKKYAEIDSQTKSADIDKLSGAEEAEEEGEVRYRFIGEQGAARLDAAEEATTRLDNLATARQMEQAYNDKKARIEKLRDSKPIELTGEEYKGKYELTRKSAQEFLLNNLRGEYTIADTGEKVSLSKVGAKKVTSHSMGNEAHLKSIVAIPRLLENAIFIEERVNEKSNEKYDSYRYYVVGLKIGNEDYTARLTVGVKKGKYYYDHYLTEIEKGNLIEIANGFTPTEGAPIPSYTESKDSRLISLLQTNDQENARKIKLATGWERGADGKWRYETPDFEYNPPSKFKNEGYNLNEIIKDDELFKAYPKLNDLKLRLENNPEQHYSGFFSDDEIVINTAYNSPSDYKYTIAHEIQHAIQAYEGFEKGDNPDSVADRYIENQYEIDTADVSTLNAAAFIRKKAERLIKKGKYKYMRWAIRSAMGAMRGSNKLYDEYGAIETLAVYNTSKELKEAYEKAYNNRESISLGLPSEEETYNTYMRNAGEVEARNVEQRMGFTPEQRRNLLAEETEDVSRKDQMFISRAFDESSSYSVPKSIDAKQLRESLAEARRMEAAFNDRKSRIEKLRGSTPVEITGNEIEPSDDLKQYKKNALEYGKRLQGSYVNKDTGRTIQLQRGRRNGGVNEVLQHDYKDVEHLQSVAAIPLIIENSIYIDSRENTDKEKNPNVTEYQYYVCGLKIGDGDYTVRSTIAVDNKGNRYYDHKLTSIEKGKLLDQINGQTAKNVGFGTTPGTKPTTDNYLGKDKVLISLLQTNDRENARKIREATGWERGADGEWHYIGGGRYRTGGEAARQADARIKEHIDKIGRKLNTPINVHESADSIQNPQVRRAIENGQRVAGWWDARDNSVHLYLPNINSRYDAERTIAHEVIGHKGLRELLGNDGYRKFMRDLWTRGDEELVSYVRAHLQGNGWDLYRTIDEYLAEKAEERVPAQGFWQRVRQFLVRQLRNIGFALRPNLNDVRYMLWLSENRMRRGNPMSEMRRNAFLYNVSKNTYTPETYADRIFKTDTEADEGMDVDNQTVLPKDVRFRISSEDRDQSDTPMAMLDKEQYEQAVTSSAFKWREAYVDYMSAFKELQDILSGGNEIPDSMNAYDAENHASSVIQEKEARFFNKEWKKFDESIKACLPDIDKNPRKALEELEMYAYKKHGLERNRVLYIRDAANRFNNEREGSGDLLIEQFHALRNELDKQLGSSEISLSQYYSTIDSFIQDKINPDYRADMNDKSGISNLTEKRDDGSFDEQAVIDSVESMEDMLGKERISDLWDAIGGVTGYSLRNDYESGIISKDSYDKVNGMFNWYIPLRGFKEDTAEDVYNYMLSEGGGGTGPTLKHAGGRTSLAESPFATMGSMASRSISNGERNKVKQRFFRLVNDYLSRVDDKTRSIVSLSSVWEVMDGTNPDGSERWTIAYPEGTDGKSADEVARIVTDFNNRMVEKAKNHEARRVKSRGGIPYRFENERNKNEHIVQVSVNGNSQLIIINGNPRAAQALNGLLNPSSSNDALKIWGRWNRWMSSMFTTMNPTFVLSNTMRDAVFSRTNIATKENASYLRQYLKNYDTLIYRELISGKLWEKYRDGKIDMNNDTERYFKEFMDNGGKTGYVELKNVEKYKKILERGVSPSRARQAWETVRTPFSLIEDVNERAENLSRFATYVTSRQMGRSVLRSISDAKDVSVNFNRKGAGAKTGGLIGYSAELMRHAYLFFNAGMQSLALLCRNIKNYPLKFAAIQFGKFFTAGAMMPIVNMMLEAMLGGDDDDGVSEYANLPEWTRRNNLCFYAGNGNFIKIPLPIELRAFYGLGDIAAGYVFDSNLRSLKSPVADIAGQLSQIAPIDFMGEGGSFTSAMMPDAIKPIWQNVINRDWTGKPIQKEDTPWNRYDPEWTKAFKSENTVAVEICKAINTMSGGDEVKKGHIDLSPAQMMNLVSGYFGGAGTTVIEAFDLGKRIVTWDFDGLNTRNIPLLKAVTSQSDDRTKFFRTRAKYYNYLDEAQKTERYISNYMKNSSNPTLIMKGISLQTSSAGLRSRIIGEYNKEIGELNKIVNAPIDDKEKEAAQSMIYRLQEQAVMKLDKVAE